MNRKNNTIFLFSLCACLSNTAHCRTITFDDISAMGFGPNFNSIPNGYAGLNWNNFGVANTTGFPQSGYIPGTISGPNAGYNAYGNPASLNSSTPFQLVTGYFTSAHQDGMSLEITGLNGATVMFDETFTLNFTGASFLTFPSLPVTEVDFVTSGGVLPGPGYMAGAPTLVLDNLTVAQVPDVASTALLFTVGLGALAMLRRRQIS